MKAEVKLRVPMVPNYILIEGGIGSNKGEEAKICVKDLSNKELEEIGHHWTKRLIERAEALRK